MTRHIEAYRHEVQHSDDADIVAYRRKSRDGVWLTISAWMIPQQWVTECWPAVAPRSGLSAGSSQRASNFRLRGQLQETRYIVLGAMF